MEGRDYGAASRNDAATDQGRALPFGVIVLDETGAILSYDRAEEKRDDRRLDDIVGKDFFTDVTPCSRVAAFGNIYPKSVKEQGVIARFDFNFPYPKGNRAIRVLMVAFNLEGRKLCLVVTGDVKPHQPQ